MFFLIPGGFGGILSYLIIFLVVRLVFKSIYGNHSKTYTHYYYTNQNQQQNYQHQQQQQQQNQNFYAPRKNYYSVLGLTETATEDEIKKAYRRLIMEYHPDKVANNSNMDEKYKEFAAKRFREVQESYEAICKLRGIK